MPRGFLNVNPADSFIDIFSDDISDLRLSRKQLRKMKDREKHRSMFKRATSKGVVLTLCVPLQAISLAYMSLILGHHAFFLIIIGLSVLSMIFFLVPSALSFSLFVIISMGLGFYLVEDAWSHTWSLLLQYSAIRDHLVIVFFLLITWFESHFIRGFNESLSKVTTELERLKKLDSAGILTKNEFLYRLEDLFVGMQRRNEQGFIVVIRLLDSKTHAIKSVAPKVSQIALRSVRTKYDIVGSANDITLVIGLQNTDLSGCNTVVTRFQDTVRKEMSSSVLDLMSVSVMSLDDMYDKSALRDSSVSNSEAISSKVGQILGVNS